MGLAVMAKRLFNVNLLSPHKQGVSMLRFIIFLLVSLLVMGVFAQMVQRSGNLNGIVQRDVQIQQELDLAS